MGEGEGNEGEAKDKGDKGREVLDIKTDFHVSTSKTLRQYHITPWNKFFVQYCSGFTLTVTVKFDS